MSLLAASTACGARGITLPKTPKRAILVQITDTAGRRRMCKLCDEVEPQHHFASRRNFLKGAAATGITVAGLNLFAARPSAADDLPMDSGRPGRRYIIRGGSVMSLDPRVGDFAQADV